MVGPLAAQLLKMIVLMTGARRILEIGMYTGYSTLAFAKALPKDGRVVTCEINPETTAIARQCFAESQHGRKIEVRLGPAMTSLKVISGPFDLVSSMPTRTVMANTSTPVCNWFGQRV